MNIFSMFFNMKVFCVFSLESPHRGVLKSTHNVPFSMQKIRSP